MREDDDLSRLRKFTKEVYKSVNLRRVHGLHRVVEHDKPERRLRQRRSGPEQRERQSVQLALAENGERIHCLAVDRSADADTSASVGSCQLKSSEFNVALLLELLPRMPRLGLNRLEALVKSRLVV